VVRLSKTFAVAAVVVIVVVVEYCRKEDNVLGIRL
jgi:hypothetical protein